MAVWMTITTSFSFYTEHIYKKHEVQISKKFGSRQAKIEKQTYTLLLPGRKLLLELGKKCKPHPSFRCL